MSNTSLYILFESRMKSLLSKKTFTHCLLILRNSELEITDALYESINDIISLSTSRYNETDERYLLEIFNSIFIKDETPVIYFAYENSAHNITITKTATDLWGGYALIAKNDDTSSYMSDTSLQGSDYDIDDVETQSQVVYIENFSNESSSNFINKCIISLENMTASVANGDGVAVVSEFYYILKQNEIGI